jgi:hypothetical protein
VGSMARSAAFGRTNGFFVRRGQVTDIKECSGLHVPTIGSGNDQHCCGSNEKPMFASRYSGSHCEMQLLHHLKRISCDVSVSFANEWSFGRRSPRGRSERAGGKASIRTEGGWWQTDALLTDASRGRSFIYMRTSPLLSVVASNLQRFSPFYSQATYTTPFARPKRRQSYSA